MCLHGRTLAVIGPNRDKVRLFNTDTDDMVGEIGTVTKMDILMKNVNSCYLFTIVFAGKIFSLFILILFYNHVF